MFPINPTEGQVYKNKKYNNGRWVDFIDLAPPIGYVYTQGVNDLAPQSLWPGTTWSNVSSEEAGLFRRYEGGNAAAFGTAAQGDAIRNIYGGFDGNCDDGSSSKTGAFYQVTASGQVGSNGSAGGGIIGFDASRVVPTSVENRPVNVTVRKWRRTA